jgi:hypothetical protein
MKQAPIKKLITFQFFVLLFLCACQSNQAPNSAGTQTQPPLLNSERIRQKFGSYGIEVLEADERVRVSNLYSTEKSGKVTRTLAIVLFPESIPEVVLPEHELIIAGGSIGETFKNHGWRVEKENLYMGEIRASADFSGVYEMMGDVPASDLAIHGYQLSVLKGGERVFYTTIVEVHHPDYLKLYELESIYFVDDKEGLSGMAVPPSILETVRDSLSSY